MPGLEVGNCKELGRQEADVPSRYGENKLEKASKMRMRDDLNARVHLGINLYNCTVLL